MNVYDMLSAAEVARRIELEARIGWSWVAGHADFPKDTATTPISTSSP